MSTLTKQALRDALNTCVEFGFKAAKKGASLIKAKSEAEPNVDFFVALADNCPNEIVRIKSKRRGRKE